MDFRFKIVERSQNQVIAGWQAHRLARDCDVVLSAWGDGYIMHPPHGMYKKVRCMASHDTPMALCSTSMGPFAASGLRRWMVKSALKRYDYLSVRDSITLRYVEDLGFPGVEQIPDTAYALRACSPRRVADILELEEIPHNAPYVGVNLGTEFMHFCEQNGIDFLKICSSVIERIRDVHGCAVILIPHQYVYDSYDYAAIPSIAYEACDDRYPINRVWNSLRSTQGVYRIQNIYSCAELKGIIAGSVVFISQRVHPLVASTSTGVPTAIMHYSHKAQGMMDVIGKPDYTWHPKRIQGVESHDTSIDALVRMVDRLWENREHYRQDLSLVAPKLVQRAFSLGDKLSKIIGLAA